MNDCPKMPGPPFQGIGHWLNQNYVIRLYGILDENKMISAGAEDNNEITRILAFLRHKIGAHSRGHRNPATKDVREITELIRRRWDEGVDRDDVEKFNLAVNTVLKGLKNGCLEFVVSLEGRPIPKPRKKEC